MSLRNNFIFLKQFHDFPGKVNIFDRVVLPSRTIHSTFRPSPPSLQSCSTFPPPGNAGTSLGRLQVLFAAPLARWMSVTTAWATRLLQPPALSTGPWLDCLEILPSGRIPEGAAQWNTAECPAWPHPALSHMVPWVTGAIQTNHSHSIHPSPSQDLQSGGNY